MRSIVLAIAILFAASNAYAECRGYEDVKARVLGELRSIAELAEKGNRLSNNKGEEISYAALMPIGDEHRAGTKLCEHRFFVNIAAIKAGSGSIPVEITLWPWIVFAVWDESGFRMDMVDEADIPR